MEAVCSSEILVPIYHGVVAQKTKILIRLQKYTVYTEQAHLAEGIMYAILASMCFSTSLW
jgi:hypothetical protein